MESAEFLVHCQDIIKNGKLHSLLLELKDEQNSEYVVECGWDLVTMLCKYLCHKDESIRKTCTKCLHQLIEMCNPKEIILGLTETLSGVSSSTTFQSAIQLISKALLKLSRRQSKYYQEICEHVIERVNHLQRMDTSPESDLKDPEENKHKMLCTFVTSIDEFLTVLIKDINRRKFDSLDKFRYEESFVSSDRWQEEEVLYCRNLLLKFVFNFLAVTVGDLSDDHIQGLLVNIIKLISFADLVYSVSTKTQQCFNSTGFIIFLHNILVKKIDFDFPFVFSFRLFFKVVIFHSSSSLESSCQASILLNLELLQFILNLMKNQVNLDEDFHYYLQKTALELTNVMIWCQDESLRKQSHDVFLLYLTKLAPSSRFSLLRDIYQKSEHPALLGFLITQKNVCLQQLLQDDCSLSDIDVNVGDLSLEFIKFIPGRNNILHDSDRLMAGLNFLRFWLLKDKNRTNKTGIWEKLSELDHQFHILYQCIDLSTNEFHKAVNTIENSGRIQDEDLIQFILPGGKTLNDMPHEKQLEVIQSGCLRVDLISCVLSRIQDLLKENGQKD